MLVFVFEVVVLAVAGFGESNPVEAGPDPAGPGKDPAEPGSDPAVCC